MLYNQSRHRECKYFCERCLCGYSKEEFLIKHKEDCQGIGKTAVRLEMPEDGKNIIKFKNYNKQQKLPYIIYADFEAITKNVEGAERDTNKSSTQNIQLHEACSYCYIVVRSDVTTKKPVKYRGPNAAEHMLKSFMKEQDRLLQKLADPKEIRMTEEYKINFKNAENCHICEKPLIVSPEDYYDPNTGEKIGQIHENCYEEDYFDFIGPRAKPKNNNKKYEDCFLCKEKLTKWSRKDSVRDHCHIIGKDRGAAHNRCNLMLKISPKMTQIPVEFHNLRGYDSHLIMQAISKIQKNKRK